MCECISVCVSERERQERKRERVCVCVCVRVRVCACVRVYTYILVAFEMFTLSSHTELATKGLILCIIYDIRLNSIYVCLSSGTSSVREVCSAFTQRVNNERLHFVNNSWHTFEFNVRVFIQWN